MIVALLAAAAALAQMFHCSAAPEVAYTVAPTPAGEFVSIMDNNAHSFDFDISLSANELSLVSAEKHSVFGLGLHKYSKFLGEFSPYHSVGDPCAQQLRPCGSSIILGKSANGTLDYIATTMRGIPLIPNSPGPTTVRPELIVIHGNCKPVEQQK